MIDMEAATAKMTEALDAIKSTDDRDRDLAQQLRINNHERELLFDEVSAILRQAEEAGVTAGQWMLLLGGRSMEVCRVLAVRSLRKP